MNPLERAEKLKNDLDNLRPLDREAEARIMQKFRLDWNYHSNNLEGNSLTYGETKALILFGITAQGKPLKDHFEITGHNEAINWILEIVKGETMLTEAFIRQLHTLLLKESSYKEAKTPDGKPTRRKIEVGKYKTQPNHVITVTGETFYFATPEETPAKMHDLIEWFRKEKDRADVNPIILAALFHYRFIRIHPFDDGNGRVARILMNFILMQFGYPPAIIKTEDKENYYAVLRLADADELEPFIEYIAQNLVRSLEIMIRGAKGESIEEPEDLDKELALIELQFKDKVKTIKEFKSPEIVSEFIKLYFPKMVSNFIKSSQKFDRFYKKSSFIFEYGIIPSINELVVHKVVFEIPRSELQNKDVTELLSLTVSEALKILESVEIEKLASFDFKFLFDWIIPDVSERDAYLSLIGIWFHENVYEIYNSEYKKFSLAIEKDYSKILYDDEIQKIVRSEANRHKEHLADLLKTL